MVSRRSLFLGAAALGGSLGQQPLPATAAQSALDIGSRLEPLVDDFLIEKLTGGARHVMHTPESREIALDHNTPWEGNTCTYHTVFQDGDTYRMYYRGAHVDDATQKTTHDQVFCYAESTDGIHWTRPELGMHEFQGSRKNNICWVGPIGEHNFAPFRDRNPNAAPEMKYRAVGSGTQGFRGLFAFHSSDAIHWKQTRKDAIITDGAFDSLNLAFYDPHRKLYVDYHRKGRGGIRDIMTCTSPDFLNWTQPEFLEYGSAPKEHLYTNAITTYDRAPHILIGLPKRYVPNRNPSGHPQGGVSDCLLMTSRDGKNFRRSDGAFVRPGPEPSRWVNRNNLAAWGIVATRSNFPSAPKELSIYTSEGYYRGPSCRLRRHSLRVDGFYSVQAPRGGGELVTRPFRFAGSDLILNYATSAAGSIRVEVQDESGRALPRFALEQSPEIFGDEVEKRVRLGSGLAALTGQVIRLRFALSDADLYSLRFG